jgi:hypothetical protein
LRRRGAAPVANAPTAKPAKRKRHAGGKRR